MKKINVIRLVDIPEEFENDLLSCPTIGSSFDNYYRYTISSSNIEANTLNGYLVLLGCTPGETILVHYVW